MSTCSQCGAILRLQAKFCNVCGHQTASLTPPQSLIPAAPKQTVLMSSGGQPAIGAQLIFDDGQIVSVQSPMTVGRVIRLNVILRSLMSAYRVLTLV